MSGWAIAPTARAQTSLDTIVIEAETGGDARHDGDVELQDYTGTHTRIDGDTLQRRELGVADVLAREPGVQRRSSGGFGSFAAITVRAASAAQTTVALDGVRLNAGGNPVVDLSTLDLLTLQGIDLYRGITPLQLGGGGIGGAVDLRTPRVRAGAPQRRVGLSLGSFANRRLEFASLQRVGRWDSVVTLSTQRAANDYSFVDGNGTPLNPDDDRREQRNNAQAEQRGALLKLGTRHGENARSDLLLMLGQRRLGVPEWRNSPDNRASFDTDSARLHVSHSRPMAQWKARHTAYLHQQQDRFDDRLGQVGLGRQDTTSDARTLGLDSLWTRGFANGTAEFKAELRRETLTAEDDIDADNDQAARRHAASLGGQWTAYHPGGRLVLVPALHVLLNDDVYSRVDNARGDRRSEVFSPGIGLRFDRSEQLALHASVARYAREPSFAELFVDRGLVRGNASLQAERGINADAGAGWSPTERFSVHATVFLSERKELIVTVFDTRGVGRAVNTGRARIIGTELAFEWQLLPGLELISNLTWQDARALSGNARLDDRQLPGEARWQSNTALRYRPAPRWLVRLEAQLLRDRYYDTANALPALDSNQIDTGIEYRRDAATLSLSIRNLLDANVEDFNGFPRPGRSVSVQFTLSL